MATLLLVLCRLVLDQLCFQIQFYVVLEHLFTSFKYQPMAL